MRLLEGKVALITGGARGIGRAIAETYAEHGAQVVLADVNGDGAQAVADSINAGPHGGSASGNPRALAVAMDVTHPDQVQQGMEATVEAFGRIDVLVNNAAILRAHLIVDFPLEDWQAIFRVNMEGTFLCSQAAARYMMEQGDGGCIINISSAAANKADPKHAAYSASKAAIVCFTRILALELGEYGIRANAILPGATETEMLQGVFDQVPGMRETLIGRTVLGKLAIPRDQANAAVFLASDLASHVTGEYLVVAGGEFMNA
jgi:NAD(P)-dependent dehydrogenase (short-subunit alcohol dehydrogenase family)